MLSSFETAVPVKIIGSKGESVLIEYLDAGNYNRGYVPRKELTGEGVSQEVLNQAIPYGAEWADHLIPEIDPDTFQNELRRHGIWTVEDLNKKPQAVIAILMRLHNSTLSELRKSVRGK